MMTDFEKYIKQQLKVLLKDDVVQGAPGITRPLLHQIVEALAFQIIILEKRISELESPTDHE